MPAAPRAIGQIALPVDDIDRATGFYRDVLGLEFLFSAPPGLAFFRCGEVRLMLSEAEGEGPDAGGEGRPAVTLLYYRVDDVDSAHADLAAAGVEVIREPGVIHRDESHALLIGFYRDSEGHTFGLMEERASEGGEGA
ncbi:MAG: VOC family protein [Gemmatimonadota bacterium]|jgi:methylmalonyl-CoA/ethylmalonyl-CoA epimerase